MQVIESPLIMKRGVRQGLSLTTQFLPGLTVIQSLFYLPKQLGNEQCPVTSGSNHIKTQAEALPVPAPFKDANACVSIVVDQYLAFFPHRIVLTLRPCAGLTVRGF